MTVPAVIAIVFVQMRVSTRWFLDSLLGQTPDRSRETQRPRDVAMASGMRMAVNQAAVAVFEKLRHRPLHPRHRSTRRVAIHRSVGAARSPRNERAGKPRRRERLTHAPSADVGRAP